MFITFESTREGLGKTTQAHIITEKLRDIGYEVILTKEPGGSAIGPEVRKILLHSKENLSPVAEVMLFNADRAEHVSKIIRPAIEEGKIVISDRYFDSSIAYQGYGRGMDLAFLRKMHYYSTGGFMPDITFLLEGMSFKDMEQDDRFESETKEFHKNVRVGYLMEAKQDLERFRLINANQPLEAITKEIMSMIIEKLERRKKHAT